MIGSGHLALLGFDCGFFVQAQLFSPTFSQALPHPYALAGDWPFYILHFFFSLFALSHFASFLLFAAVISTAFGFLGRRKPNDRLRYIFWSFFLFLAVGIGIAWAMFPVSR